MKKNTHAIPCFLIYKVRFAFFPLLQTFYITTNKSLTPLSADYTAIATNYIKENGAPCHELSAHVMRGHRSVWKAELITKAPLKIIHFPSYMLCYDFKVILRHCNCENISNMDYTWVSQPDVDTHKITQNFMPRTMYHLFAHIYLGLY